MHFTFPEPLAETEDSGNSLVNSTITFFPLLHRRKNTRAPHVFGKKWPILRPAHWACGPVTFLVTSLACHLVHIKYWSGRVGRGQLQRHYSLCETEKWMKSRLEGWRWKALSEQRQWSACWTVWKWCARLWKSEPRRMVLVTAILTDLPLASLSSAGPWK